METTVKAPIEVTVLCKECKNRKTFLCPMYWIDSFPSVVKHDRTVDEGFCDRGERA